MTYIDQRLYEEAGLIGELDDCDVSWAFEAQAEVVLERQVGQYPASQDPLTGVRPMLGRELGDAEQAKGRGRVYESFDALAANPDEDSDAEWMLPLQREALELSDATDAEGERYLPAVQLP